MNFKRTWMLKSHWNHHENHPILRPTEPPPRSASRCRCTALLGRRPSSSSCSAPRCSAQREPMPPRPPAKRMLLERGPWLDPWLVTPFFGPCMGKKVITWWFLRKIQKMFYWFDQVLKMMILLLIWEKHLVIFETKKWWGILRSSDGIFVTWSCDCTPKHGDFAQQKMEQ